MTTDFASRARVAAAVVFAALAGIPVVAATDDAYRIAYLARAEDPGYQPHRAYTGLVLRDRHRPLDGARLAIRDSRIVGRALGFDFELIESVLEDGGSAARTVDDFAGQGVRTFLLDLPLGDVEALADSHAGRDVLLFNIRHADDHLRGEQCSPVLFHTLPSRAMMMDALAQHLLQNNWKQVLVLEGPEPADQAVSAAFQASARKYRLDLVDVRAFVLGHDPRLREYNNIGLLTAANTYDVVFLADTVGEFGRYVPYDTHLPRPVIGSEGLQPGAWHWTWERHGAPQLNQRFHRAAGRPMEDTDYAAWIAVKSVVEAIARTTSTDNAALRRFLVSDAFTVDTYKGVAGNYRSWNNQLRQAVLLHRHNAVIARAPVEGFLHEHNELDTLGVDRRESNCAMR